MNDNNDVPVGIRQDIVKQELQMWKNTRYLHTIRYRVCTNINDQPGMDNARKELEKCEKVILEYEAELKAIQEEIDTKAKEALL